MSLRNRVSHFAPALAVTAALASLALSGAVTSPAAARPAENPREARAAAPSPVSASVSASGFWAAVSRWLGDPVAAASAAGHGLRSLWGAEGASLDPHGGAAAGSNGASGTGTGAPLPGGAV
ncbi:MAG TPA: hypothetical protein VMM92_04075 [Thermoanaerobaculia bacterium]|nr:hypothetical protein [Thermoanaerobaculia bacterium]